MFSPCGASSITTSWLPGIADGTMVGTLAVDEGARHAPFATALTATPQGNSWLTKVYRQVIQGKWL